jgi:hypothetical protein
MSKTETVNLTISAAEVRSISEVASIIAETIQSFAEKYGVADQYDKEKTEQDLIYFLVKRNAVGLEQLEVHVLEDGEVGVGEFSGKKKATLIFRINYVKGAYRQ